MKQLRHFFKIFSLGGILLLHASEPVAPVTPILIAIDPDATDLDRILLFSKSVDLEEARVWLAETSEKFGRRSPIIIQITTMEDFSLMRKVATVANESHDDIFFRIPTYDLEHPFLYLRFDSPEPPVPDIRWGAFNKKQ